MTGLRERLGKWLGIDHRGADYAFVDQPGYGPVSASRAVDRWVRTTCGYCSVGCGMLLGVRDGRAVAVQGDPDHPVNRGKLCPKGLSEHHTIHADGRLMHPTIDGRRASWDDALDRVVGGFRDIIDEHGPESVAVISTGQLVTEEFYTLGKLARLGLGLAHFDGNTTLCMASAVAGYKLSFGTDGPPGCYDDFALADVVVLWGANIADNHPLLAPRILDGNRTIVAVDPRVTKTAMIADLHVAVRPRGDIALLNGVLAALLANGRIDVDAMRNHIDGLDELVDYLADWNVERAAAESGVDVDVVRQLTATIGDAERCVIAWTMGVNHSVQGTMTVTLLNTLALLTGNIGKPGAAPMSITGQCNAMGTRESGFTATMPGYRPYEDAAARTELASVLGIDEGRLPRERGKAYPDIIEAVADGTIKGLWIIGTNPVVSYPNRERLERTLAGLELLVVQDGFATPTTAIADVVLPAAIWGEKDGTFTNSERRVSRVRAAVAPPGEARTDFDIFLAVAERWGCTELFAGWRSPIDAFDEWRRVSAGRPCDYSGITWDRIDTAGGVQWPCPADDPSAPLGGTARLFTDLRFNRPNGSARAHAVAPLPLADPSRKGFPYQLNTGRTVEHWHTRTKTGRVGILERLAPEAWVELNPKDAAFVGVQSGDMVRIESAQGAIESILVRVTETVRAGEIFVPFHWNERCANRLTRDEFDPISREPNYKQCAVRVEKLNDGSGHPVVTVRKHHRHAVPPR